MPLEKPILIIFPSSCVLSVFFFTCLYLSLCGDHLDTIKLCTHKQYVFKKNTGLMSNIEFLVFNISWYFVLILFPPHPHTVDAVRSEPSLGCFLLCRFCVVVAFIFLFLYTKISIISVGWPVLLFYLYEKNNKIKE